MEHSVLVHAQLAGRAQLGAGLSVQQTGRHALGRAPSVTLRLHSRRGASHVLCVAVPSRACWLTEALIPVQGPRLPPRRTRCHTHTHTGWLPLPVHPATLFFRAAAAVGLFVAARPAVVSSPPWTGLTTEPQLERHGAALFLALATLRPGSFGQEHKHRSAVWFKLDNVQGTTRVPHGSLHTVRQTYGGGPAWCVAPHNRGCLGPHRPLADRGMPCGRIHGQCARSSQARLELLTHHT